MMTDPHILGFGEIEVDGFNLKSLGYGANSFVFEVTAGGLPGSYLKVYKQGTTSCVSERTCLLSLATVSISESGYIPKLLQSNPLKNKKNWDALLMCPVANAVNVEGMGSSAVRLYGSDFSLLVTIVQGLHNAGWTHRDIKPSSVLYNLSHNHVILIDFDSALELSKWTNTPRGKKLCAVI